jgi:hypothetical protein
VSCRARAGEGIHDAPSWVERQASLPVARSSAYRLPSRAPTVTRPAAIAGVAKIEVVSLPLSAKVCGQLKGAGYEQVTSAERRSCAARGFYGSAPTPAGRAMGLRSFAIGYQPLDPAVQGARFTALALDEFGKASAWLQGYGGSPVPACCSSRSRARTGPTCRRCRRRSSTASAGSGR